MLYQRKVGDLFFPELLVILSNNIRMGIPSSLFPLGFMIKIWYAILIKSRESELYVFRQ
jgi:hypothetical protein